MIQLVRRSRRRAGADHYLGEAVAGLILDKSPSIQIALSPDHSFRLVGPAVELRAYLKTLLAVVEGGES